MSDQPNTPQADDDTEGHMPLRKSMDTEAATEDDAEGHGIRVRFMDTEAATEDDVEGHVNFINPDGPQDQA